MKMQGYHRDMIQKFPAKERNLSDKNTNKQCRQLRDNRRNRHNEE